MLKDPWDVVAFPKSSNLFISDWESDCIWRVSTVDGKANQLIRDVGQAPRLSATVNCDLVAASDCSVTVYRTLDGGQLRHIPLDGDARHAVMVDASKTACYIVCYYFLHEVLSSQSLQHTCNYEAAKMQQK